MWTTLIFFLWINGVYSSARKELLPKRGENYDDESENIFPKTSYNYSRLATTTDRIPKPEVVVEKFVETLMASERYLKLIETVDAKLVHLESTFLERTNTILKYLTEVLRVTKSNPVEALQSSLHSLKNDLDKLKHAVTHQKNENPKLRGEFHREKHGKRKQERLSNILWKKEYEKELNEAMLAPARPKNVTRMAQSPVDNEVVIEKLMETITASEKHLKKIESIDFRLNRLDIEVHEKTDKILKQLLDITTAIDNLNYNEKVEAIIGPFRSDIEQIKSMLENHKRPSVRDSNVDTDCHLETALDNRLSFLETHMKSLASNMEVILNVISEVKNRQRSRNFNDSDQVVRTADPTSLITEFRRVLQEQKSKKCDCRLGRVDRSERYPTDCQEIQAQGFNVTGIYKIKPDDVEPFYVLCDLNSAGGGWTVIQNRFDGSQDFYKNWIEYKHGFGNLAGEFWLGLEKTYYLTNQKLYELRVEMEAQHGQEASATYSVFTLGPEYEGYRISTLGTFRGNAGDSLSYHAGQKFSTYDSDNDEWKDGSCSIEHGGAWWYKECDKSNLNGKYLITAEESNGQSIYWISFNGPTSPLYKTRMMIRPLPASRPVDYNERTQIHLEGLKPHNEKKHVRGKDTKNSYEVVRGRMPYRYDVLHPDGFFPNYT